MFIIETKKTLSHGGNLYFAKKEFGIEEELMLDYSSNINPMGVPEELKKAIINDIDKLSSYPNIDYVELVNSISDYLELDKKYILPTNGATEAIYLILQHLKLKKVLIQGPSFSEYKNACENFSVEIKWLYNKDDKFVFKEEEFYYYIENSLIDAIFLCNPNNPTSQLIEKNKLISIARKAKEKNIYVIVDESFIDLIENEEEYTIRKFIKDFDNIIIIQSFTKFFGIPGLRIGCALGNESLIKEILEKKMPWSINYFASLISVVLKRDSVYVKETKEWIRNEVERFYNRIKKIEGLEVYEPNTNFVLVKILNERLNSHSLREELGKKGVLIRDCSNFKGLNDRFVRFAIKDKEKNEIFIEKLKEVLEER